MLDGFKPVSLTIGVPSVSITNNGIAFNKSAVIKMNKSEYVSLMINEARKMIAIQQRTQNDNDATFFFNEKKKIISVRWNNKDFLNTIEKMMDWDFEKTGYRITGDYYNDNNLATLIFNLNTAIILESGNKQDD